MPKSDYAQVEVGGFQLTRWTQYRIGSSLLEPADAFDMRIPIRGSRSERQDAIDALAPDTEVRVSIVRQLGASKVASLQMTGVIDDRRVSGDRDSGTAVGITGRDNARHLTDADADPRLGVTETKVRKLYSATVPLLPELVEERRTTSGLTFTDLVRKLVAPWNLDVVTDGTAARDLLTGRARKTPRSQLDAEAGRNLGLPAGTFRRSLLQRATETGRPIDAVAGVTANPKARDLFANKLSSSDIERISIKEAKPAHGESIWDFIQRHAQRFGCMVWMTPDGKLIISSPNYGSAPLYRLVRRLREDSEDRNNILDGWAVDRSGGRYSEVTVFGRSGGRNPERSPYTATVTDDTAKHYRPHFVYDDSVRSDEEAERRAQREINQKAAASFEYSCSVADHGQGEYLYSIDNMAEVHDEVAGVYGTYYIVSRDFVKTVSPDGRSEPTVTQLRLFKKGAIAL